MKRLIDRVEKFLNAQANEKFTVFTLNPTLFSDYSREFLDLNHPITSKITKLTIKIVLSIAVHDTLPGKGLQLRSQSGKMSLFCERSQGKAFAVIMWQDIFL